MLKIDRRHEYAVERVQEMRPNNAILHQFSTLFLYQKDTGKNR